jgi:hypothetical protein
MPAQWLDLARGFAENDCPAIEAGHQRLLNFRVHGKLPIVTDAAVQAWCN